LAGYAFLIYQNASHSEISKTFVLTVIISDSIWVVLSILLLLTSWVPFTNEGKWAIAILAIIVDVFSTLQFLEWRKM
jgi:hypothetical protein